MPNKEQAEVPESLVGDNKVGHFKGKVLSGKKKIIFGLVAMLIVITVGSAIWYFQNNRGAPPKENFVNIGDIDQKNIDSFDSELDNIIRQDE